MKAWLHPLLSCRGEITRGWFALAGFVLFFMKYGIDSLLARVCGETWNVFSYLFISEITLLTDLSRGNVIFFGTMLTVSLPFLFLGLSLTVQRLRDARLPLGLVVLMLLPFIKVLFFGFLCFIPTGKPASLTRATRWDESARPRNSFSGGLLALVLTFPVGLLGIWVSTNVLSSYGWTLFVGLPFLLGFLSVLIYSYSTPRGLGACLSVAFLSSLILGASMLLFALEGLICLIMAAPLWSVLGLMGGSVAWAVFREPETWQAGAPRSPAPPAPFPLLLTAEHFSPPPSPLLVVRSAMEIDAPPETVWRNVVAFAELPPPDELLFRLGIAYPLKAEITGQGEGAVRHCVFSTGAFTEPITVWQEPRLLKFSVTSNPPPMEEWTPYHNIHPPHLAGFLASEGGQFLLTPLANGRTRVEGTTWYRHHMFPAAYWQLWSDHIIHTIHLRVLRHIKQQSETRPHLVQETLP